MVELEHTHVPSFRISHESRTNLLKTLVAKYSGMGFDAIVANFLNKRGKKPPSGNSFIFNVEYPEPGVLRTYCGANTCASIDEVIVPDKFRPECQISK